jgi:predicted permease
MDSLLQDLRFAARILYRSPGISCSVILALALGIGANSAMFSVVDALLLHPLRYRDPNTLVVVWDRDPQGVIYGASAANYLDWRSQAKSLGEFAGWVPGSFIVKSGNDRPEQVIGATVTANFFGTLGVKPILGRPFLPAEDGIDSAAAAPVVMISHRFWQQSLGGDPNVLGRTIDVNSVPRAIVGVMPPDFQFLWRRHEVWIPAAFNRQDREYHYLTTVARLQGPRSQAIAEMTTLARSLEQEYPKSNKGWAIQVDDLREWLFGRTFRTRLLLLFGAVGLVLLIACTNVASLLMARSAARRREIALRISIGATRLRLTRQLLTESLLLAIFGGAGGLGLAWVLIRLAPKIVPPKAIPPTVPIELSMPVILFTIAISLLTGILFGLAPALAATGSDVQEALKDSSRGSTAGRGRLVFRQVMVVGEVAVALILLASASLMIESLNKLTAIDLGFDMKNVLTVRLFIPASKYSVTQIRQFHRLALQRIAGLPGVKSVSLGSNLPLHQFNMQVPFDLETSAAREQGERPGSAYSSVSVDYFRTLGIPLRRGRMFAETDSETAPPVVIVNQAFADRYFPHQDPVGKRMLLNRPILGKSGFEDTIHPEIVGVAGNVKLSDLSAEADPIIYAPETQNVWNPVAWFAVRTASNPANVSAAVRGELMAIDKDQPVDQTSTLEQSFTSQFAEPNFQTELMGTFAALALILAVVGIYGVNAYAVVQRRHEIGVRMALGASQGMVLKEILTSGMRLTALGIGIGLMGALAIASLLKSVLVGISATDPWTLTGVSAILAVVAAIACYVPARKATRIDPAIALRQD